MPHSRLVFTELKNSVGPEVRIDRSGQRGSSDFAEELDTSGITPSCISQHMILRSIQLELRAGGLIICQTFTLPTCANAALTGWFTLVTFDLACPRENLS
jgi:hypothetical protein